jgi:hypothetical protein
MIITFHLLKDFDRLVHFFMLFQVVSDCFSLFQIVEELSESGFPGLMDLKDYFTRWLSGVEAHNEQVSDR